MGHLEQEKLCLRELLHIIRSVPSFVYRVQNWFKSSSVKVLEWSGNYSLWLG